MTNLEGSLCRLRALEPEDAEAMYRWENDPSVWGVSGTLAPFSLHVMKRFIDAQADDPLLTRQLRLVIETLGGEAVGLVDLFEYDPYHLRAGVGILIHDPSHRGRGIGADALALLSGYARDTLLLNQLWCNVESDNAASLGLFRSAGFTEAGIKRRWNRTSDGWKDEILLQKLL